MKKRAVCAVLIVCMCLITVSAAFAQGESGLEPREVPGVGDNGIESALLRSILDGLGQGIGKQVFGWILNFLHAGVSNKEILDKLIEMDAKLNEIIAELGVIEETLEQLEKELAIDTKQIEEYIKSINADKAMSEIETYLDEFKADFSGKKPGDVPKAEINEFAGNVMSDYTIEDDVELIKNAMIPVEADQEGVLQLWTDQVILKGLGGGEALDFSTTVETTNGTDIVVERPTYFNNDEAIGGHVVMGREVPSTTFHFAEGTTRPDFETFFCIANVGNKAAEVRIDYARADGTVGEGTATRIQSITVPANSRYTVNASDVLGSGDDPAYDFSTTIESINGVPILAERPMYFCHEGVWIGGHAAFGTDSLSDTFYFAEGTTRPGYEPYLCIGNTGADNADVKITYMLGDGTQQEQTLAVPGQTRRTVRPADVLGVGDDPAHDFSTLIECTNGVPVVAERPMYFNTGAWSGGHDTVGAASPGDEFYFAEGTTRPGYEPYLCMGNMGTDDAAVKITYMLGDGTRKEQAIEVPGRTRRTVRPADILGQEDSLASDFSATVESTNGVPVVAERPMYFNTGAWSGGHATMGAASPADRFYFAEGTTRPGYEPYFCIQNPGDQAADVKITHNRADGKAEEYTLSVPSRSRATVRVGNYYSGDLYQYYLSLEQFFSQFLYYQIHGATMVCEAKNLDPDKYGTAKEYMDSTLMPMIRQEADEFFSCAVQLVLANTGDPLIAWNDDYLPADAGKILSRADWFTIQVGQEDHFGLRGVLIGTRDILDETESLYEDVDGTLVPGSSKLVQTRGHVGVPGKAYDCWSGQSVKPESEYTVIRYDFGPAENPGTYKVFDAYGNTEADAVVEGYDDNYQVVPGGDIYYGCFVTCMRIPAVDRFMDRTSPNGCSWETYDVDFHNAKSWSSMSGQSDKTMGIMNTGKRDDYIGYFKMYPNFNFSGTASTDVAVWINTSIKGATGTDYQGGGVYGKIEYLVEIWDNTDQKFIPGTPGNGKVSRFIHTDAEMEYRTRHINDNRNWWYKFTLEPGHQYALVHQLGIRGSWSWSHIQLEVNAEGFSFLQ